MADTPYKLSRGAMRKQYGSRAIDASAPQATPDQNIGSNTFASLNSNTGNKVADAASWGAKFNNSPFADSVARANQSLNPGAPTQSPSTQYESAPLTGYLSQAARSALMGTPEVSLDKPFSFGGTPSQSQPVKPTLTEMAAGGTNSATAWQNAARRPKPVTTPVGRFATVTQTPGIGFKRLDSPKFGWGYSRFATSRGG